MTRAATDETSLLLRRVNGRLMTLRAEYPTYLPMAEQLAGQLRYLVLDTADSDAAERARVRATVHYFAGLRDKRQRAPRSVAAELKNVDRMVRDIATVNWSQG